MSHKIDRKNYSSMFGPTVGDKVRLGDTDLWVEIEKDFTVYGDELKFGGSKSIRDGMGQKSGMTNHEGALDFCLTNAIVLDYWGIVKADIGIKDGKIAGIGKAGNPDTMDGVNPRLVVGTGTEVLSAEGLIVTAGAIDTHVHYICPQADRNCIVFRRNYYVWWRRWSGRRLLCNHMYTGALEYEKDAGICGRASNELHVLR